MCLTGEIGAISISQEKSFHDSTSFDPEAQTRRELVEGGGEESAVIRPVPLRVSCPAARVHASKDCRSFGISFANYCNFWNGNSSDS